MEKLIRFIAETETSYLTDSSPLPAKSTIPQWFKDLRPEHDDIKLENGNFLSGKGKSTLKKCVPFLDSLTTGYMFCLPFDIGIEIVDGNQFSYWKVQRSNALEHDFPYFRTEGVPIPSGYSQFIWRFNLVPGIKTPSGYSVLVTHPLNRYDLPFLTMSAVIDTDKYNLFGAATVFLQKDFSGIIPKGTPLAQVIPFKRDNWKSTWEKPNINQDIKNKFNIMSIINRSYQTQYWSKKTYK
jgi:hypothetical protein